MNTPLHITARSVSDTRISGERAVGIKEGLIFYNSMFDNGLRRIEIGALINIHKIKYNSVNTSRDIMFSLIQKSPGSLSNTYWVMVQGFIQEILDF